MIRTNQDPVMSHLYRKRLVSQKTVCITEENKVDCIGGVCGETLGCQLNLTRVTQRSEKKRKLTFRALAPRVAMFR